MCKAIKWGNKSYQKIVLKVSINCYLKSYTKINSKWIIDPNIKPKIIKLVEEIIREKSLRPLNKISYIKHRKYKILNIKEKLFS